MKHFKNARSFWLFLAVSEVIISVPNGLFVKNGTSQVDPLVFNAIRFGLMSLVALPYVWKHRHKLNSKNLKYAIYTGLSTILITGSYVKAISLGSVSYLSIFNLITPIVFIIMSALIAKEKLKSQSLIGMMLAAVGAFLLVSLPLMGSGDGSTSNEAIFYALIEAILFPLIIILPKKADDKGLPIMMTFAIAGIINAIFYLFIIMLNGEINIISSNWNNLSLLSSAVYSGIIVGLIARWLNVVTYEKLGSALLSSLAYAQYVLAVILPIFILKEKLPPVIILSGILIMIGVVVSERQHPKLRSRTIKNGHH